MVEQANCQICYFPFNRVVKKPLYLPCEHTICAECVNRSFQLNGAIMCPVCRADHPGTPIQMEVNEAIFSNLAPGPSAFGQNFTPEQKEQLAAALKIGHGELVSQVPQQQRVLNAYQQAQSPSSSMKGKFYIFNLCTDEVRQIDALNAVLAFQNSDVAQPAPENPTSQSVLDAKSPSSQLAPDNSASQLVDVKSPSSQPAPNNSASQPAFENPDSQPAFVCPAPVIAASQPAFENPDSQPAFVNPAPVIAASQPASENPDSQPAFVNPAPVFDPQEMISQCKEMISKCNSALETSKTQSRLGRQELALRQLRDVIIASTIFFNALVQKASIEK